MKSSGCQARPARNVGSGTNALITSSPSHFGGPNAPTEKLPVGAFLLFKIELKFSYLINPFYQFSGADFSQIRDARLKL